MNPPIPPAPTGGISHEAGELHRLLVDRVLDYAIFALDPTGVILTWNAGAERLKGYAPHEIIGKHFSIFYGPDDLAGKPERILQTAVAEGRVTDEGWRFKKDHTRFWASVVITALRDDSGTLLGFAKVTRDLTERREAEEALRLSEERFRLLVESVGDYAIFMLDATGHVATWNEGAQRIKGYTAKEIIGRHFSAFYPAADVASGKLERELETATRVGRFEEEGWRVRKDGTLFWANVVITAVRDSHGKLVGFAKVTRDLTERKAAQEREVADARRLAAEEARRSLAEERAIELRELTERLHVQKIELERRTAEVEAANRAKSEFLAAMSHELRTPLNAIGGYAQLMQLEISGTLTQEQHDQLDRIQRSKQHLLGVINDLLNFSRIEAGQVTLDIGQVVLVEVMEAAVSMIAPLAAAKEQRVTVHRCPPDVIATADRAKVDQIVVNLLSNAVKFTGTGGDIVVTCETTDGRVHLHVQDTGVGIAAHQLERVFEPFVQVGRSLASPKEGTGLGLAISRDLARAMSGDLTAESRESFGSTFTLTLPVAG